MDGLKKGNGIAMRDERERFQRKVTSMLVTNAGDQMWLIKG